MYRASLACVSAIVVIVGALSCSASEPEQAPAEKLANLRTAALQVTAGNCSTCLDIRLSGYNLFVLENYSGGTNIEGKVAAGGSITLNDFSVGSALPDDNVSNTLVAGGNLALLRGGVFGAVWYGGSYTPDWSVNIQRGTAAHGTPIDFAARFAELRSLSSRLAAQAINGTTQPQWGNVYLTGTDPCLNVFEVQASDFNSAWVRHISVPAGSFALVNIIGTGPTLRGGFNDDINPRRVLYNFVDATSLDARGFGLAGTVLAPHARATLNDGSWSGGIYAVSLIGNATGRFSPLDELEGTTDEACNGADDNCNGQIDEGFECAGASSRSCTAWCGAAGTQTCDPATCGYGECASASCCRADADCGGGSFCEGSTCAAQRENGESCSSANQCASGQCVDGVCCNGACDGACDACNLTGSVGTCGFTPATVRCRDSAGTCDVEEYCTGMSASCPADIFLSAGTACTPDGNSCTLDMCNGSGHCAHPPAPVGVSCNDGNACTTGDVCNGAGTCGGSTLSCNSPPDAQCYQSAGTCTDGACSYTPKSAGTSCNDGNTCTTGDVCNGAGTCGGTALSCNSPPDAQCYQFAGTCTNGACSYTPKPAGTSCNDGSSCTSEDVCNGAGSCTGNVVPCSGVPGTTLRVPEGATQATVSLWGAGGGGGNPGFGGGGAWVNARIPVTPGDRLDILAGRGGQEGGGGGGASYLFRNGQLMLVAAGGGGAGVDGCGGCSGALDPLAGAGGGGGFPGGTGQAGRANNYAETNSGGGQGGTQSAGGAGGTSTNNSPYSQCSSPGLPGSTSRGGAVRGDCTAILVEAFELVGGQGYTNGSSGGGGAGRYGGGSGGQMYTYTGGGGGGGSSWIHPSATLLGGGSGDGPIPGGVTSPGYSDPVGRGGAPVTRGSNGQVRLTW
ncbi:choice-of-anchor A family protein [Hyalangium rubrum]|uniref:Choice-of-anchor A family protein n=1 Tax=Hyalangium rubrum TaxID=3103134 RepID=A0ABU5H8F9_9BACT|nr:choice-of-anchor A family protein [Hyalangium sp. s54d21]MDY7229154.1 choice-of-anchor A family protein [Hyalangium sp. s54d21]